MFALSLLYVYKRYWLRLCAAQRTGFINFLGLAAIRTKHHIGSICNETV